MRLVIIEDEGPAARRLTKLIHEIDPKHEVLAILESVTDSLEWFSNNPQPDLVLSDIQLSDNLSFEIYKSIELEAPIIFTTAFDQYAIQAFEHLSVDYLLKPIRLEQLQKAFDKLERLKEDKPQLDIEGIIQRFGQPNYRDRFMVYSGENLISFALKDIAYFYSEDGVSFIKTWEKKRYIINESLDKLESKLDPKKFFRANRQLIVSFGSLVKAVPSFNQKLRIYLEPDFGEEVFVSKLKATEFKAWMNS